MKLLSSLYRFVITWKRQDWHVFLFFIVISHLFSNLHWKVLLFLFCQLTALLEGGSISIYYTSGGMLQNLPEECLAGEAAVTTVVNMLHCGVSTDTTRNFASFASDCSNCTHLSFLDLGERKSWHNPVMIIKTDTLELLRESVLDLWRSVFLFSTGLQWQLVRLCQYWCLLPAEQITLICVARNVKVKIVRSEIRAVSPVSVLLITGILCHLK